MVGTRAPLCGEGVSLLEFSRRLTWLGMAPGGSRFDASNGVRPPACARIASFSAATAAQSPAHPRTARPDLRCLCGGHDGTCHARQTPTQILRRRPRQIGRADRDKAPRPMPAAGASTAVEDPCAGHMAAQLDAPNGARSHATRLASHAGHRVTSRSLACSPAAGRPNRQSANVPAPHVAVHEPRHRPANSEPGVGGDRQALSPTAVLALKRPAAGCGRPPGSSAAHRSGR